MRRIIRHNLAVGLTVIAMVVVTRPVQSPTEQLGTGQEAVDLAIVAGEMEDATEDKDVAKKATLAVGTEAQEVMAPDNELMARVLNGTEQAGLKTIKADFRAVEHLGAAHQSIEKGEIPCTIDKATGETPTSCGYGWLRHHDVRQILFNHSTCEAGPISPMRKIGIGAVDRAPLMGRVYAGCHDESP